MASFPLFNYMATGIVAAFNSTSYFQAFPTLSSTESDRKIKYRSAGVMSKLEVIVSANTIATSATTVRNRLNGANGNLSVSIGAGLTGSFTDASNTQTIAAGDDYNYQVITPNTSGSITVRCANTVFAATTNTVGKYINRNAVRSATTPFYEVMAGGSVTGTVEANAQVKAKTAGTAKNLFSNVVSNSSAATTTIRFRKNGGNGNMVISIGAAATGQFEDTSNTDSVAVDDLINYVTTKGDANSMTWGICTACEFETTDSTGLIIEGQSGGTVNANLTRYIGIGSDGGADATEASVGGLAQVAGTYSKLACFITANTVVGASTLKFRKNAGNGNQSVSITSLTTGFFEDASNTDTVATTDTIDTQLITNTVGTSLTLLLSSMKFSSGVATTTKFLTLLGVGT